MRKIIVLLLLPAALVACAAVAPTAAGAPTEVITDCNSHGGLTRHYSSAELRSALSTMPADIKEYTNCYDVIQRALLAQLGSGHGGGGGSAQGSGGSFLPTPLLVLLALLVLATVGFAAVAARRRLRHTPDGS